MRNALAIYIAYDLTAKDEGWAVFGCDDGVHRIQTLDHDVDGGTVRYSSDASAIRAVRRKAAAGSQPHRAALHLHGRRFI